MEWLNLVLSLTALGSVGYLFWRRPWAEDCELALSKAKRFAEDGDAQLRRELTPEQVQPSPEKPKEKPHRPRSFVAWKRNAELQTEKQ